MMKLNLNTKMTQVINSLQPIRTKRKEIPNKVLHGRKTARRSLSLSTCETENTPAVALNPKGVTETARRYS